MEPKRNTDCFSPKTSFLLAGAGVDAGFLRLKQQLNKSGSLTSSVSLLKCPLFGKFAVFSRKITKKKYIPPGWREHAEAYKMLFRVLYLGQITWIITWFGLIQMVYILVWPQKWGKKIKNKKHYLKALLVAFFLFYLFFTAESLEQGPLKLTEVPGLQWNMISSNKWSVDGIKGNLNLWANNDQFTTSLRELKII